MVKVKEEVGFKREGLNIRSLCYLTLEEALRGCEKEIDTLDKKVTIKIKAGAQNDQE